MSSFSDGTYQRPGRSKSASPVHHGDVAGSMEDVASITVLKDVVQQLSSLARVVWNLHGHIHGNEDVQQARRTPEDSQHGEGCELGSDFLDIVIN